jgi:hypothetical protein
MAQRKANRLKPRDIQGLKYLKQLAPLFEGLRDVGCQRDNCQGTRIVTRLVNPNCYEV